MISVENIENSLPKILQLSFVHCQTLFQFWKLCCILSTDSHSAIPLLLFETYASLIQCGGWRIILIVRRLMALLPSESGWFFFLPNPDGSFFFIPTTIYAIASTMTKN